MILCDHLFSLTRQIASVIYGKILLKYMNFISREEGFGPRERELPRRRRPRRCDHHATHLPVHPRRRVPC